MYAIYSRLTTTMDFHISHYNSASGSTKNCTLKVLPWKDIAHPRILITITQILTPITPSDSTTTSIPQSFTELIALCYRETSSIAVQHVSTFQIELRIWPCTVHVGHIYARQGITLRLGFLAYKGGVAQMQEFFIVLSNFCYKMSQKTSN